eukprot:gb/GFBE01058860.1/.p1 GENE.gb/GFBE01058860.1/~~gb/GFBE01058860.1/.p1  ORF type:complete len:696 (+),score=135.02 gb/GFBE01058860.1/:1-2088(+)
MPATKDTTWQYDDDDDECQVEVSVRGTFLAFRTQHDRAEAKYAMRRNKSTGSLPHFRQFGGMSAACDRADCGDEARRSSTEDTTASLVPGSDPSREHVTSDSCGEHATSQKGPRSAKGHEQVAASETCEASAKGDDDNYQVTAPLAPTQLKQQVKSKKSRRRRTAWCQAAKDEVAAAVAAALPLDEEFAPESHVSLEGISKTDLSELDMHAALRVGESACFMNCPDRMVDVVHHLGKLCETMPEELAGVAHEAKFRDLMEHLKYFAGEIKVAANISHCCWGLAKLGQLGQLTIGGKGVSQILSKLTPLLSAQRLSTCTNQDLSLSLWSIARLAEDDSSGACYAPALEMAHYLMQGAWPRLSSFTPQCLANSLYAVAKLGAQGPLALSFAERIVEEMCLEKNMKHSSTQGIANAMWAAARLEVQSQAAVLCSAAAEEVLRRPQRLHEFQAMELSMTMWAISKICKRQVPKSCKARSQPRTQPFTCKSVVAFMLAGAAESESRIQQHSPQGLSNIAMALTGLQLHQKPQAKSFLLAAAHSAMQKMQSLGHQAVANLCSSFSRLQDKSSEETVQKFMEMAAWQAHLKDFSWQDLAEIVTAMSRSRGMQSNIALQTFAARLAQHTAAAVPWKVGKQALLNIGLAAVRMGVPVETVLPLATSISTVFAGHRSHGTSLNGIDYRQWQEIQTYCDPQVLGRS